LIENLSTYTRDEENIPFKCTLTSLVFVEMLILSTADIIELQTYTRTTE